jgi:hypothetical protein
VPSRAKRQAKLMAMAAHDKGAAKRVGVPQSVARDFNRADQKTGILKGKKKR